MTIKGKLIASGRFIDIVRTLNDIANTDCDAYEVQPYFDSTIGGMVYSVPMNVVISDIKRFFNALNRDNFEESFPTLYKVIKSKLQIIYTNCAINMICAREVAKNLVEEGKIFSILSDLFGIIEDGDSELLNNWEVDERLCREELSIGDCTTKETLMEARRYENIRNILFEIINGRERSLSVGLYLNGKDPSYHIDGEIVRMEAEYLLDLIENKNDLPAIFDELSLYVNSEVSMKTHNFTINLAHRKPLDEGVLDNIRCWLILQNLLDFVQADEGPEYVKSWTISEGWKRRDEE